MTYLPSHARLWSRMQVYVVPTSSRCSQHAHYPTARRRSWCADATTLPCSPSGTPWSTRWGGPRAREALPLPHSSLRARRESSAAVCLALACRCAPSALVSRAAAAALRLSQPCVLMCACARPCAHCHRLATMSGYVASPRRLLLSRLEMRRVSPGSIDSIDCRGHARWWDAVLARDGHCRRERFVDRGRQSDIVIDVRMAAVVAPLPCTFAILHLNAARRSIPPQHSTRTALAAETLPFIARNSGSRWLR